MDCTFSKIMNRGPNKVLARQFLSSRTIDPDTKSMVSFRMGFSSEPYNHMVRFSRKETIELWGHINMILGYDTKLFSLAPSMLESLKEMTQMCAEMLPKAGPCGWGEIAVDNAKSIIEKMETPDNGIDS